MRTTQFHDFAAMVASWTLRDGVATIAPLLVQPIGQEDVAQILADIVTGNPLDRTIDTAGPRTEDLVDMARGTFAARGHDISLAPTWRGVFDETMAGEVLLPGPEARLGPTTFDEWLAGGPADGTSITSRDSPTWSIPRHNLPASGQRRAQSTTAPDTGERR